MTIFDDYFREHNLPLMYENGYIYVSNGPNAGYNLGGVDYDEFDEYRPILDLLSQINDRHPEIAKQIENISQTRIELTLPNRTINMELWGDDISISQDNYYDKSLDVHNGEQVFDSCYYIKYLEGVDISRVRTDSQMGLSNWLQKSEEQHHATKQLLSNNKKEFIDALHDEGYLQSNHYLTPVEYTYRRVGNAGNLREIVDSANLGKLVRPNTVSDISSSVLVRTPDDWIIDCCDYEKDGQRYIRTHIFYQNLELDEPNPNKEYAVSVETMAYQMIPADKFAEEANKLFEQFKQFNHICYQQSERLSEKFQTLDVTNADVNITLDDLMTDSPLTL